MPQDIDVVMLCGGRGERLRNIIKDRPKPMAEIKGKPFLDILIDYVAGFGFRRFILCIGYKGDFIKRYYQNRDVSFTILFSEEKTQLGTAGALKNAAPLIKSNSFLVMNGDSFCKLDLNEFINFHINKNALFSIALVKANPGSDYGVVNLDSLGRTTSFNEKTKTTDRGFFNAGIYLFRNDIFSLIPANKSSSLEYDLFPNLINKSFYGYITENELIDIGIPERYRKAMQIL